MNRRKKGFVAAAVALALGGVAFGVSLYLEAPLKRSPVGTSFSGKKAFAAVKAQTDFGPRVPETESHRKAGDFLVAELKAAGWQVIEQKGEIEHPLWKRKVPIRNIIGILNPEVKSRVLLSSHWDSRPMSDNDPIEKSKPIDGANDGASGVGILLELAKLWKASPPEVGVDILFWDFEDTGEPRDPDSYCLGSQYWAKNPHVPGYTALYGINLDMVGGFGAEFPREGQSDRVAGWVYDRLQSVASELGYSKYFPDRRTGSITDDHVPVIQYRSIPMVDLIHVDPMDRFISTWHTLGDRIDAISPDTLEAVGRVIGETVSRTKIE